MNCLLRSIRHLVTMLTLTLLGVLSPLPAMAYEMEGDLTHYPPVSEEILDSLRGGFQFGPKGPVMSFGIERDVFLNHKLVSSTAFNIPDVTRFAASPSNAFTLIQHGSGNSAPHNLSSLPPLTTVIQNTLDNQAIQTHTVINATVAALMWARALDLGHALSQANIGAIQH